MLFTELTRVIEQVGKDKGISHEQMMEVVKSAMVTAAKKKFGSQNEIDAVINEDTGEVELYLFKKVVEKITDPFSEIIFDEAKKLDEAAVLGDELGIKLDSEQFGRIAAQIVKQVIIQKVRDKEKEIIYNEFKSRQGEIISGICRRVEHGNIIVDLGKTEAVLPIREQIPGETFRVGDRVQAYLLQVQQSQRGPRIILSRSSELFLMKLFELEIPEVREGIIEIKGCAREPGVRAKIAVFSKDRDVDPVGACVGMKGARVQNIIQELKGEKIDIVPWSEEITKYVCNAISPAEVVKVVVDDPRKRMDVVVPDDHLSLAIGKKGLNVRLASRMTEWDLDVVSESRISERLQKARENLMAIPGMSETMALSLYQHGIDGAESLITHDPEVLGGIPGMTPEKAQACNKAARNLVEQRQLKSQEADKLTEADSATLGASARGSHYQKQMSLNQVSALREKYESAAKAMRVLLGEPEPDPEVETTAESEPAPEAVAEEVVSGGTSDDSN
jgi:transcription termination/antitermination protein NusA